MRGAGDVNRDGYDDIVVGTRAGYVEVKSGRDGRTLWLFRAGVRRDLFGEAASSAGDVDRDGYPDLVVGAPDHSSRVSYGGSIRIYSGRTGKIIHEVHGRARERLGYWVAPAGDVNRDGYDDVVTGATGWSSDPGFVYVVSGRDGSVLFRHVGLDNLFILGWAVASAGDVDADGHPDIVAGAGARSYAIIYSGKDGSVLRRQFHIHGGFGGAVDGAGDVDNDGYADVILGDDSIETSKGRDVGAVSVLSGKTGKVLHLWLGERNDDSFGWSVAGLPDVDRDGRPDLLASGFADWSRSKPLHYVRVFSGRSGRTLYKLLAPTTRHNQFGESAGAAGDVNRDGIPDFVVGAPHDPTNGVVSGACHVFSGRQLALASNEHVVEAKRGGSQTFALDAGSTQARRPFILLGTASDTRPGVRLGSVLLPLNLDTYTGLTLAGANQLILNSVALLDPNGRATSKLVLPPLPASVAGTLLHHAYVVVDPRSVSFRFASNPVPLRLR